MTPRIESLYVRLWIEDGIICAEYALDLDVDMAIAREAVETRLKFANGKVYPLIADIRGFRSITKDAREYFSNEGARDLSAAAIITGNPITRTIAEIFMAFNKPRSA